MIDVISLISSFKPTDVFVQTYVTFTLGMFVFLSIIFPLTFSRIKEYFKDGSWSYQPAFITAHSIKIICITIVATLLEFLLFFTEGIIAFSLLIVSAIFNIAVVDRIIAIFILFFDEMKEISKKHQKGSKLSEYEWNKFYKTMKPEELKKLSIHEQELLCFEHNIPKYDKFNEAYYLYLPYAYIIGTIDFLSNKIEEYKNGVPLDRLVSNLYSTQSFFGEERKDIESKIYALKGLDMIKIENRFVIIDYNNELTKFLIDLYKYNRENQKKQVDAVEDAMKEVKLIIPDIPLTSFLEPFYRLIYYLIYSRRVKKSQEVFWNKVKENASKNQ